MFLLLGADGALAADRDPYLDARAAWTVAEYGCAFGRECDLDADGLFDLVVGTGSGVSGFPGTGGLPALKPAWIVDEVDAYHGFGMALWCGGDATGDGVHDLVVGASGSVSGATPFVGAAYLYAGVSGGAPTPSDWSVAGDESYRYVGWSVGGADLDGDGLSDLVVSMHGSDEVVERGGRVDVWRGDARGLSEDPDWTATGSVERGVLGWTLDAGGDTNNDGYADLSVGAAGSSAYEVAGSVHGWYGGPTFLAAEPDWTLTDDEPGATFGSALSTGGDVDGDGFDDVLVGAPYSDRGTSNGGRAALHLGSPTGPAGTAAWEFVPSDAPASAGYEVSIVGDLDLDGFADLVLGEPAWDNYFDGQRFGGRVLGFQGGPSGPAPDPSWRAHPWRLTYFGYEMAGVGDVTGDGYPDVVMANPSGSYETVLLYLGPSAGVDEDFDGHGPTSLGGDDCDDTDGTVHPGLRESCDGRDEDCDGLVDASTDGTPPTGSTPSHPDADGDGWGADPATWACTKPAGSVARGGDCDDADPSVRPMASERCDGRDDDCDGSTDEDAVDAGTWYADADGDGHGDAAASTRACTAPEGHVSDADDCDDTNGAISPDTTEECGNGLDDDCDAGTSDTCADGQDSAETGDSATEGPGESGGTDKGPGCGCGSGRATPGARGAGWALVLGAMLGAVATRRAS